MCEREGGGHGHQERFSLVCGCGFVAATWDYPRDQLVSAIRGQKQVPTLSTARPVPGRSRKPPPLPPGAGLSPILGHEPDHPPTRVWRGMTTGPQERRSVLVALKPCQAALAYRVLHWGALSSTAGRHVREGERDTSAGLVPPDVRVSLAWSWARRGRRLACRRRQPLSRPQPVPRPQTPASGHTGTGAAGV